MEKILDIVELIAYEKGLSPEVIKDVVKNSILKVARECIDTRAHFVVDDSNKDLALLHAVEVCADGDPKLEQDPTNTIALSQAHKDDPSLKPSDILHYEISLKDMKRSAVNALFKDLEFNIQKSLEDQYFQKYKAMLNTIVKGVVLSVDEAQNTYIEIENMQAVLALKNRIKGESFKVGDSVRAILKNVRFSKQGLILELSRTTPKFLEALLHLEVPEIADKEIEVMGIARIPGDRAKLALRSLNNQIDPIGATVGVKGVRINAISKELCSENIDCVHYNEVPEIYIANALSPAHVIKIKLAQEGKKSALVTLYGDQKSKAIGRNGVNVRLACMLTGYDIDFDVLEPKESAPKVPEKVGLSMLESLFSKTPATPSDQQGGE
ncbi:transcription termination protein NusA [Helicobacter bizzozeronii CIII-1]|uniref:Transcription termination/antitermination protein NusA n=1 Tax=Helicobacter bizzozeronii (strain CIII-1) TaxID=1002804 RepID=F8KQJ5_HELBC|nr:transcription termination factor NusA [Helicobacter bizzozeronii]CCB78999.1 transcription termination protein NusA [Helicobacter bizzozeronii CIII-1]